MDAHERKAGDEEVPEPRGRRFRASTDGLVQGTPFYMAPERARNDREAIDERTDVFSLGGILYEILTLTTPYTDGTTREVLELAKLGAVAPPREVVDAPLSPWLCDLAMKAMSRKPEDRFQSVAEMKAEVEAFLQSGWQYPRRVYAAGDLIVREGEKGDEAFIILHGRCRVFKEADGRRTVLREMDAGEVFGETAVLTGEPRAASVEAMESVTVAVVAEKYFKGESGMEFWMGQFMKVLAVRFRELDARKTELERALEDIGTR
jgi:serine/threonine-protein kinase